MKLTLVRDVFNKQWTQGKLYVNDAFYCYTLEYTDRFLEAGKVLQSQIAMSGLMKFFANNDNKATIEVK